MASKAEIQKTILRVAGNPVSGSIAALAGQMAEEIAKLDEPDATRGKQKRVTAVTEVRDLPAPTE